jgi:hypothetical protein
MLQRMHFTNQIKSNQIKSNPNKDKFEKENTRKKRKREECGVVHSRRLFLLVLIISVVRTPYFFHFLSLSLVITRFSCSSIFVQLPQFSGQSLQILNLTVALPPIEPPHPAARTQGVPCVSSRFASIFIFSFSFLFSFSFSHLFTHSHILV